ncbi:MAG: hypothetical protein DDT18_01033 [Actinobacteria bacterium]|nr:hypothetical protein [Actinomycetota bacterium]
MTEEKILKQILSRLERLETAVFGEKNLTNKLVRNKMKFKGITGGIRLLVSQGFFKDKKTFTETKTKLRKNGYYSSLQAIQTALNSLSVPGGALVKFKEGKKIYYAERK